MIEQYVVQYAMITRLTLLMRAKILLATSELSHYDIYIYKRIDCDDVYNDSCHVKVSVDVCRRQLVATE